MSIQSNSPPALASHPLYKESPDINLQDKTADARGHQAEKVVSTSVDTYAVGWQEPGPDARNPTDWSTTQKWTIIILLTGITLIP